ncbi:MAG: ligase-associated DNA damage response endonuclease PdeM [Pseudomonadota bacterium]
MDGRPFTLNGTDVIARPAGTLWWPGARLLAVADLHLGKAERMARRGGTLLPPYEARATLERLRAEVEALSPATIVCLGDSFDDTVAGMELEGEARGAIEALMTGRRWIWVAGNHDPVPPTFGGEAVEHWLAGPLHFRHIAATEPAPGEVSGHYHPKIRLFLRGRGLSSRCFVHDGSRAILPAFGTYTGGLSVTDPALASLVAREQAEIILARPGGHALPLARVTGAREVQARPAARTGAW